MSHPKRAVVALAVVLSAIVGQADADTVSVITSFPKELTEAYKKAYEAKYTPVVFYDVPLLFENRIQSQFDAILVVWCQRDIQLNRLMLRNNLNQTEALSRIKAQMPLAEKIFGATYCIDNSGSDYEIIFAVDAFLEANKLIKVL